MRDEEVVIDSDEKKENIPLSTYGVFIILFLALCIVSSEVNFVFHWLLSNQEMASASNEEKKNIEL